MFDLFLPRLPFSPLALLGYAGMCAAGLLAAVSVDQVLRVQRALRDARSRRPARPYQYRTRRARQRVLIVGDSTGVGVGADHPTEAIGGLLAADYRDAELVNLSIGGACIADVPAQLRHLGRDTARFDLVLLHVGGNDIMRSGKLDALADAAEPLLLRLRHLGRRVVWLGPGDLGLAPLFRPPFSWWMSRRTEVACEMFRRVALRHGVEYVGFHAGPHRHLLARERARYFASDGLHPSSHGYRYAYGCLKRSRTLAEALAAHHAAGR
ncbi:GDSL-type esterase/lipase family protein [Ideonella sp.]|uniref:GDSL-type esterase/lipase family protein n=1 Tax=Ideonella sp. TaxID=1929293 RepID=UPI002B47C1F4|nr:GDSL-type esterase/lipase family protein [Ideonella sp.]HJV68788.1 GDSL-type esterase/lipase family protein [Ideonella sp.]